MLKTINYAVFKCTDCGNQIKVQPSQVIDKIQCECLEKKVETPKEEKKPAPKKKAPAKKKAEPKE